MRVLQPLYHLRKASSPLVRSDELIVDAADGICDADPRLAACRKGGFMFVSDLQDWKQRHAALIGLAQIAEGCAKVMQKNMSALVDLCLRVSTCIS
jgi:hypothetical protein